MENGATLILSGGLYQMLSLNVEPSNTVLLRGASHVLIKRELDTDSKAKIVLDQGVAGLTASQMVFYVEGDDASCGQRHGVADVEDEGDRLVHRYARAHRASPGLLRSAAMCDPCGPSPLCGEVPKWS